MDEDRPGEPQRTAVVVGGGIGGLGAARALQLAGWRVQVLERAQRLEPLGAGITLWPNALRALTALDVRLPHPGRGGAASPGGIRTSSGRWLTRTHPATFPDRYGAPLLAVHRAELHQALLGVLLPDTVVTGTRVTGVLEQGDAVVVEHAGGSSRADLVVLADGLSSPTRHLVTGALPRPRYAGYTAWRGVTFLRAELPEPAAATESWGRGQRFGIVPLADGRTYWFATATTDQGGRSPGGEHAEVLRRFAGWHAPIQRVVQATEPSGVLRHDVYDLRPDPTTYVRGRLVLLGDAAHAMTPDLGQGACQALEDAATLGALIGPGADLAAAVAAYDANRRPRAQLVARRSRQLGRLGQLRPRAAATTRNLLLSAAPERLSDRELDATLTWRPPVT